MHGRPKMGGACLVYSVGAMSSDYGSEIITFLFADLESSTRLWETVPDAMAAALERHDAILDDAVSNANGHVLKRTGDGIMAIFSSASDGVRACVEAQQRLQDEPWPETGPLRVRMGMHAGQPQQRAGDFFGPPVNRAARIMGAAHGGQVLLSAVTAELARDRLPDDVALRDLGEQRLKDLLQPERIFQLLHPALPAEFAPVETLDRRPNNLPTQISEFLGREVELSEIQGLLGEAGVRLLTLVGPGGIGKTRLALQAAADQIDRFDDGLYLVDLSPVRDRDAVFESIVRAVGLTGTSPDSPLDALKQGLAGRELLLLLDNFEQVIDAAADIAKLLAACPRLKVLVTSREALRLRGERLFHVPPLGLPAEGSLRAGAQTLAGYEAVRLFSERAREAQPGFALTDDNAAAVAEICARLDGLPLAIELAAARLRLFSPEELRDRLRGRLELLRGGARDLPARQRTLRSTIEWSYELLDEEERSLFGVLSVFSPTGVTAVEEVAIRLEQLRDVDVIDRLASLTDKSLVLSRNGSGFVQLTMLETIRDYAEERLEGQVGLGAAARRAHAEYFAEFAGAARDRLEGPQRDEALDELEAQLGNLRTAWRYWVEAANLEKLNDLVDALWALYDARGWYHAAVELTRDLLGVMADIPSTAASAAEEIALRISLARSLMAIRGYSDEVEEISNRALVLLREAGDVPQRYQVLRSLATFYLYRTQFDKAAVVGRELLEIGEKQDDIAVQVEGHLLLGCNIAFQGDVERGLAHLDRSMELFDPKRHGSRRFRLGPSPGVVPRTTSAFLYWMDGYADRAVELAASALELADQIDHPYTTAYALFHVGLLDLWRREPELARQRAVGVMEISQEHDYQVWNAVALVLHGVALIALGRAEEGLEESERGISQYQGLTTPPIFWPVLLSLRAGALGLAGRPHEGLEMVDEAIALTPEGDMLSVELALLKGDLLAASDPERAASCYERGYEIAARGGGRMGLLHAAMRVTQLRRARGSRPDGADALRSVYETFTEGFESRDLVEARALLGEVQSPVA
jgi:predicted ATPase/class 3 adenylate cyclase